METQTNTPCHTCRGTAWTARGLCRGCETPILKHEVTAMMDALAKRPNCFEAYGQTELSDANRIRLQRIQSLATCNRLNWRLNYLRRTIVGLGQCKPSSMVEDQLDDKRETVRRLEKELDVQRHILALPDAELIELLNELEAMRGEA